MQSVYDYSCPNSFLRDWVENKKQEKSSFTLRSISKKLDLKSHASLSLVINGERQISKQVLPKLIELIGLNEQEGKYFETLIDYKKSKTESSKVYYCKILSELHPIKDNNFFQHINVLQVFSKPISVLILELIQLEDCRYDPSAFISKSAIKTDKFEVSECLDLLLELGLVYLDEKNCLRTVHKNISTPASVQSLIIQNFHKRMCLIAKSAVEEIETNRRFFSSFALRFHEGNMSRAQEMIDQFIVKFAKEFEAEPLDTTEIFQFNLQFFPITKIAQLREDKNENALH